MSTSRVLKKEELIGPNFCSVYFNRKLIMVDGLIHVAIQTYPIVNVIICGKYSYLFMVPYLKFKSLKNKLNNENYIN